MDNIRRITQLKSFLEDDPNDAFLLFALGKELASAQRAEEALACYEQLRTVQPEYVGLYYHLGQLHEQMGQPQKARETYLAGITVASSAGDHHARSELEGVLALLNGG